MSHVRKNVKKANCQGNVFYKCHTKCVREKTKCVKDCVYSNLVSCTTSKLPDKYLTVCAKIISHQSVKVCVKRCVAINSSSKSVNGGIFFDINSAIFNPLERVFELIYSISFLAVER